MVSPSFMHHLHSFTGDEDPEDWLDDFYTTALDANLSESQMLSKVSYKFKRSAKKWFDSKTWRSWEHFLVKFFDKYSDDKIKSVRSKCEEANQRKHESLLEYYDRYSKYLKKHHKLVKRIASKTTTDVKHLSIHTSDKVDSFIGGCKHKKDQSYLEDKGISTMEEVKYHVYKLAKKLKRKPSVDSTSTTDEESDDTSSNSIASTIDLDALATFNSHLQDILASNLYCYSEDLTISTDNTADDIIVIEDDYPDQTIEEGNFILMSDIPSKLDELSLDSLIEEGSRSSLLESTAEEIKEFSTTNNGTDLDDILDIFDLYFTSTDNGTDTATTSVSDEELEVSHSVSTANDFTLTFETIPQNIAFYSTIQPLEGEFHQASLNVSVREEIDASDHISVTPVLLSLKHYLPLLLELGLMLFKFKIILLVFVFEVSDLFSKLSTITLNYLELLNSQQYVLFYAACPPTFIYKRL